MIKDLVSIANKLDQLGLFKEADSLDKFIKEAVLKDEGNPYQPVNKWDKITQSMMPWDTWNSLPKAARDDLYNVLGLLSWVPILNSGSASASFVLKCFEKDWKGAALGFIFILISFFMASNGPKVISLLKPAGGVIKQTLSNLLKDMNTKDLAIDWALNELSILLENAINSFNSSTYFKEIGVQLTEQKPALKQILSVQITRMK